MHNKISKRYMKKREFLKICGLSGVYCMMTSFAGCTEIKVFFRKLKGRLKKTKTLPPETQRGAMSFAEESQQISVETALNSRCSSDYDDDPAVFHWGMYDRNKKITAQQIEKIIAYSKIEALVGTKATITADSNMLSFIIDTAASGIQRDWLMIQSGMQQQAAALVCAALGVGNVLKNQGKEGREISDTEYITIKMKLDAMKPSYSGSFWSTEAPRGENPWLKGNLPDPLRTGNVALLDVLQKAETKNNSPQKASQQSLGQLLWAARGRTPHLYKSRPWGMTIPTWAGENPYSSVYLMHNAQIYLYSNWENNRPSHYLHSIGTVNQTVLARVKQYFPDWNTFLIFETNNRSNCALWETGYQFVNIIVQAHALTVKYHAVLLDKEKKALFTTKHITNPVAAVALDASDFSI